jgi:hypothetical protein
VLSSPFPVVGIVSLPTLLSDSCGEFERASALALGTDERRELRAAQLK